MKEYRLTVTWAELGRLDVAEANMGKVVDAFERMHPEVGAVAAANFVAGTLDIVFALDADGAEDALGRGREIYAAGSATAHLGTPEIVQLGVELVLDQEFADDRELQPA